MVQALHYSLNSRWYGDVQEVAHRWIVGPVGHQSEMKQAGGVVDEVRNEAPPQVEFPEILVGEVQVRIA